MERDLDPLAGYHVVDKKRDRIQVRQSYCVVFVVLDPNYTCSSFKDAILSQREQRDGPSSCLCIVNAKQQLSRRSMSNPVTVRQSSSCVSHHSDGWASSAIAMDTFGARNVALSIGPWPTVSPSRLTISASTRPPIRRSDSPPPCSSSFLIRPCLSSTNPRRGRTARVVGPAFPLVRLRNRASPVVAQPSSTSISIVSTSRTR